MTMVLYTHLDIYTSEHLKAYLVYLIKNKRYKNYYYNNVIYNEAYKKGRTFVYE